MKLSKVLILVLALLVPQLGMGQNTPAAERAWKPFFAAFRATVKKRDRDALSKILANSRRAIKARSFEWYAVFEFRDGRWYCTGFTECCD